MKLPEITMSDWQQAEEDMRRDSLPIRPPGSITAEEYAAFRGFCPANAQKVLKEMCEAGKATRQKWRNGLSGTRYLYQLKKNGVK